MLAKLNAPQRDAVRYLDGPLLVLAGAGSGKTRVITHKIAYLMQACGYAPEHIAAITFTNKAAREMQARVAQLLPGGASRGLTVTTFHSLGLQILRAEASHLGYKPRFSVLDQSDAAQILSELLKATDRKVLRKAQYAISRYKNALIGPQAAKADAANEEERQYGVLYERYQATLGAYQAVDFDDLIRLPVELFQGTPDILEKWRRRLRYLLIDEYQDTNACQYALVKAIAGVSGAFTAVGDDDQAIYAWRGANVENLARLRDDFPTLEIIKLEQNYRSSVRILRAANTLISHNAKTFEKRLWSDLGMGEPIRVVAARDEEHEAQGAVMQLLAHKFEHRTRFSDYAILYRGNHQARVLEQWLRAERVPYSISGGTSFFERAEIKDVLAYLRVLANPDDDPAFIRAVTTPKRGVGVQTLERLGGYAAQRRLSLFAAAAEAGAERQLGAKPYGVLRAFCGYLGHLQARAMRDPAPAVARDLLSAIQYEAYLFDVEEQRAARTRWDNVLEFVAWLDRKAADEGKNLLELTQSIALITMLDSRDDGALDAVRLSTLHAAKGLEFGHVFLIGVEEGILPHRESLEADQVAEERRLMYVGITRAQRSLTLSYCRKRKRAGEWVSGEVSRFVDELGDELRISGKETGPSPKADAMTRLAGLKAMLKK
ncbi:MAG: UvrD-helicase domain-containing protein [Betaproteobacteria bacterium]|nr:UvrD-helicase domain-containing protein [Betaproteobacteria bacterium]